ncbi:MAG: hypothetical protein GX295_03270 [Syntrophomonadaceae bacterium]|nr:hypothetical protein [Syntrophomonadaceae bacterium]
MTIKKGSSWLCGMCGANKYEEVRKGITRPFLKAYEAVNGRLFFGAQQVFVCPSCTEKGHRHKTLILSSGQH